MRADAPRLPQLEETDWDESLERYRDNLVGEDQVYNIFKTLANYPDGMRRWLVFANHVLFKNSLSARDREILILRIGWLCQAEYEWAQHVIIAKDSDLNEEEIERIKQGPGAPGWSAKDKLLLEATGELHSQACMTDKTWDGLKAYYDDKQMVDVIFTVGNYNLVSMMLNSLGVPLDDFLGKF